jgi:methionyl-tRNA formyltransferase
MKIVYIGTVNFSYHCLCEVLKNQGDVVGIVSSENTRNNSDYCDLTPIANQYNIPIHYCKNINDPETIGWIKTKNPDVVFCWGWSQLIKSKLLSMAPMGVIGVHPALLPQNRGRHPLIWALVLGLKVSGLTFFFMDEGVDSGHILSQKIFEIADLDTANSIYGKIQELATIQIADFLPQLVAGTYKPIIQDLEKASYWRKRSSTEGMIDWRMNAIAILNLIRALTKPYPGAQFNYKEQTITVWVAHKYDKDISSNIEPGKIIIVLDGMPIIKCYDSAIVIDTYEPSISFIEGEYIK